jgi:hypothetical protein
MKEAFRHSLPVGLTRLIDAGVWPGTNGPSMTEQQHSPIVSAERVRLFAPDESLICLQPPPFHAIADEVRGGGSGDFWTRFGSLRQIVPAEALIIGDFGLGSDSPVVLDFNRNKLDPPVLRLRWVGDGPDARTEWVQGARGFEEFAQMLGLFVS